jgi:hypothetical protein
MTGSLTGNGLGRPPPLFEPVIERLHRRLLLCCDRDATVMMVPRPRLRDASRALCAGLVPRAEGRVTDPRPIIFLPWENRLFYDGPRRVVTDMMASGNYNVGGLL